MVRFQCHYCNHLMQMRETLTGRTILCPLCETHLLVPEADPSRKLARPDLARDLDRYKLTDWDRRYAKALLDEKAVPAPELQKAIAAVVKAGRKGGDVSISDQLRQDGQVSEELDKRLRESLKGVASEGRVIECPNCFASILAISRSCRFCGQTIGDAEKVRICPNCKDEQPADAQWCGKCTANMVTGLLRNQEYCHRCTLPIHGNPSRCPKCGVRLREDPDEKRRLEQEKKRQAQRKKWLLPGVAAGLVALLILGAGLYSLGRRVVVGGDRIALEKQLSAFCGALQGEADPLPFVIGWSGTGSELRTRACTGRREPSVTRVVSLQVGEIVCDGESGRATVSIRASVHVDDPALKIDGKDVAALRPPRQESVTWHWVLQDGEWRYEASGP